MRLLPWCIQYESGLITRSRNKRGTNASDREKKLLGPMIPGGNQEQFTTRSKNAKATVTRKWSEGLFLALID